MSAKDAYQKKLMAKIKEWDARIDQMKAQAEGASAEKQLEYYKTIDDLREKQNRLQKRLQELESAGADAWEDIKVGIESAWKEIEFAFDRASGRFKSK